MLIRIVTEYGHIFTIYLGDIMNTDFQIIVSGEAISDLIFSIEESQDISSDLFFDKGNSNSTISSYLINIAGKYGLELVIQKISSWLKKDKNNSLKIQIGGNSIELSNVSSKVQEEMIEWFKIQTGISFSK